MKKHRDGHRDEADYGSVLAFQDVQTVMGLLLSSGCKLKKKTQPGKSWLRQG